MSVRFPSDEQRNITGYALFDGLFFFSFKFFITLLIRRVIKDSTHQLARGRASLLTLDFLRNFLHFFFYNL